MDSFIEQNVLGADYDLRRSDPSDLDPHSVSSIFKNFLRQRKSSPLITEEVKLINNNHAVPEPLLTHSLSSSFDDVLTSSFDDQTSGTLLQRKNNTQLIRELRQLVWKLPVENRAVLRELCHLLGCTAHHVSTTKMPLTNLVLVFCPTLQMNSILLSLLVETQDDIFEPLSLDDAMEFSSFDNLDQKKSGESTRERPARPNPLIHQRSVSDMKLLQLTEMSRRNNSFGRTPPASLAPIVVPISVSAASVPSPSSSAPGSSAANSYTSSVDGLSYHNINHSPSSMTPLSAPNPSASTRKHSHNASLPLPAMLSDAFVGPIPGYHNFQIPPLTSSFNQQQSSIPFKPQRDRMGSSTSSALSEIDEVAQPTQPRSRTPSATLKSALGAFVLAARGRSNTSPNGPEGTSVTTPTSPVFRSISDSPAQGGRLSRRSSSFFPITPKLDKFELGLGGSNGSQSLASRGRKGSLGNLNLMATATSDSTMDAREFTRPPHLSMIIPGGGTGQFLTSPLALSNSPTATTPTKTSPNAADGLPTSSPPMHRTHVRVSSSATVLGIGNSMSSNTKRWSVSSTGSKRWSGTGSTSTATGGGGRNSKRASWNEPPAIATALIDNTPALGSFNSFSTPPDGDSSGTTPISARSATPIADLFRGSSSSVDLGHTQLTGTSKQLTHVHSATVTDLSSITSGLGNGNLSVKDSVVENRSRSGSVPGATPSSPTGRRPLPTIPNTLGSPVQSAIAALTQVQASSSSSSAASTTANYTRSPSSTQQPSIPIIRGVVAPSTSSAPPTSYLGIEPSSSSLSSTSLGATLAPRIPSFGGLRKKRWSRRSAISSTTSENTGGEEDWASSVLAQISANANANTATTTSAAAAESPAATLASKEEEAVPVEVIRDGTVRDARRVFESSGR